MTPAAENHDAPNALRLAAWMLDESDEAALATDVRGQIVYVNKAFEALTGYVRAAALGRVHDANGGVVEDARGRRGLASAGQPVLLRSRAAGR